MQSMITAGNRRSQINRSIHNQAPNVIRRGSACVPARLATYHQLQHPREIKSRPPTVSGKALAAGKSIHRQSRYRWQTPFRSLKKQGEPESNSGRAQRAGNGQCCVPGKSALPFASQRQPKTQTVHSKQTKRPPLAEYREPVDRTQRVPAAGREAMNSSNTRRYSSVCGSL